MKIQGYSLLPRYSQKALPFIVAWLHLRTCLVTCFYACRCVKCATLAWSIAFQLSQQSDKASSRCPAIMAAGPSITRRILLPFCYYISPPVILWSHIGKLHNYALCLTTFSKHLFSIYIMTICQTLSFVKHVY